MDPQQQTLQAPQQIFEVAVKHLLQDWTLLALAVQNSWGGPKSQEKANNLYHMILSSFQRNPKIDPFDLANMIDDFVSEQLSTEAEDGSVDKIANLLVKIFNESLVGDYTTISAVMAQTPQNGASQSKFIQSDDDDDFEIEGDEEDDGDEEDEDADDDMDEEGDGQEDDDGWTVVKKKK